MPDYQINDQVNLRQRIGTVDMKVTKLGTSVIRVDSEIDDLKRAVERLNGIITSMRIQVSDLRRGPIPEVVFNGTGYDHATNNSRHA